jgi:hypothetical protein
MRLMISGHIIMTVFCSKKPATGTSTPKPWRRVLVGMRRAWDPTPRSGLLAVSGLGVGSSPRLTPPGLAFAEPGVYAPTCLHLAKADIRAQERRAGSDPLQPPSDPRHRYGATAIAEISAIGDRVPLRWSSAQSTNTLAFRYFGALTGADRSSVATAVGPVRSCCAFVLIHLALLFI